MVRYKQVTLNPSFACNRNCIFCAVENQSSPQVEDVEALLRTMYQQGYTVVSISGGEPTLQKDLPKWISQAKSIGYRERIVVTNGSRLNDSELLKGLINAGLTHINVSFHCSRESVFDTLEGTEGAYREVVEGLHNLVNVNVSSNSPLKIHANIILTSLNLPFLPETVRFLTDIGFPIITIELCRFKGKAEQNYELLKYDIGESLKYIEEALLVSSKTDVKINHSDIPSCFLTLPENIDFDEYLQKRARITHKVASAESVTELNRSTHVKPENCSECAFSQWCSGYEKSMLTIDKNGRYVFGAGNTNPEPVNINGVYNSLVHKIENQSDTHLLTATHDALNLIAPPHSAAFLSWASLYEKYALKMIEEDLRASVKRADVLEIFSPKNDNNYQISDERYEEFKRREYSFSRQVKNLTTHLKQLELPLPCCCGGLSENISGSFPNDHLFHLYSLFNKESSPFLNNFILPVFHFFPCTPHCETAIEYSRRRLDKIDIKNSTLIARILGSPGMVLGPFVKLLFSGKRVDEKSFYYRSKYIILITPGLDDDYKNHLFTLLRHFVLPFLDKGNTVKEKGNMIQVFHDHTEIVSFTKRLTWTPYLVLPDTVELKNGIYHEQ